MNPSDRRASDRRASDRRASDRRAQVSAFMDGEIRGSDSSRVVEDLYGNPERRRTWSRYHRIGDAMRGTASVPGAGTIAARVSAQLAGERVVDEGGVDERVVDERVVQAESRFRPRIWTPLRGLALAASVAAVAMLGIVVLDDGSDLQIASTEQPASRMPSFAQTPPPVTGSRAQRVAGAAAQRSFAEPVYWPRGDAAPDAEARINTYLINHSEHGGHGLGGVLPYVRVVGYQSGAGDDR